jgi:hypothetical protein
MRSISARAACFGVALGTLAACGSSSPTTTAAVQQYVTGVQSGDGTVIATLSSQAPQTGSSGPAVSVNSSGAAVAGAAQFIQLTCSTDCTSVAVAVQGVDGYYQLSGLPDPTTQTIVVFLAQTLTEGFDLLIGAGTGSSFGPLTTDPVTLTPVAAGDVEISLNWGTPTDLDLHVVEPSGEEIYYGNKTSATGGMLDLDSNAGCDIDGIEAEHVTWPGVPQPTGTYEVIVDPWSLCGVTPPVNYTVIVNVKGKDPQIFHGAFSTDDEGGACWVATGQPLACSAANLVTTFTYP